ncbi:hypothetical protein [Methylorubrum extorquens]|uniref:Uncharacterized protein n=1 Tax=Methylorubrum extorquens DSM 13060 TaxID=882800 RepID=H1KFL0_METEX|nr:hypothetical protein [Methylorubrum extorquens]EHP93668.1 hypothetical protein MetexDRAFT_1422 [Methylorubrum extorquens DSM 13060]
MQVTAIRAVQGIKAAMEAAGLKRTSRYAGAEIAGWIETNRLGSTGFSIRPMEDGRLHWHVVLSGKPHLQYSSYRQVSGDDTVTLHEPVNPERLFGQLRDVFEGMGLTPREIRVGGWQGMWDDDVDYNVVTDYPAWLATYDPANRTAEAENGVTLRAAVVRPRPSDVDAPPCRANLPVYVVDGEVYLTRESVAAIAKAASDHNREIEQLSDRGRRMQAAAKCSEAELAGDGTFRYRVMGRYGLHETSQKPTAIVNHWGDEVTVWKAPHGMMQPVEPFATAVPVLVGGEMQTDLPFAVYDAQFGPAPWSEPAQPQGPRP